MTSIRRHTDIDLNPGGLTDTVVQPISLGWHFKKADVARSKPE